MRITLVITIDPVKEHAFLALLVHSLNLQTSRAFDVVFFNQTLTRTGDILRTLDVTPRFSYRSFAIPRQYFFGEYPIWDLYAFHSFLLRQELVGDFVMSLHSEEFLAPDYIEQLLEVLHRSGLDILFGNLTRTHLDLQTAMPLLDTRSAAAFEEALQSCGARAAPHWAYRTQGRLLQRIRQNLATRLRGGIPFRPRPTRPGFRVARSYCMEDVFVMRTRFAREVNWFLEGYSLPFEDIHICDQPGVCELVPYIVERTRFPAYFDRSQIYHVRHPVRYFQLVDPEFTDGLLALETDDPVLVGLQEAIMAYRSGRLDSWSALMYSRQNPGLTGTQNLNYAFHRQELCGDLPRDAVIRGEPMADFIENG